MKEKLTLVKVGGKIVEEPESLQQLLNLFTNIKGKKVLVHGGGRTATDIASKMDVETKMIDGRRVTDSDMLKIVTMVYGGLVNKNIVSSLSKYGVKALGLTGADMDIIRSHKRINTSVDYGFVGDVDKVDAEMLSFFIDKGIIPVLAPLTHDAQGCLLNTNADTIAGETAKSLASIYDVTLVFCFEKKGVLANPDDDDSVISHIDKQYYEQLKADGIVQGGMLPKLDNSFAALNAGVSKVIITRADCLGLGGTTISL